tara:strand:+ start:4846 stop:5328 length:483 start_codon:yes stop_codon:yes gene_type:complete
MTLGNSEAYQIKYVTAREEKSLVGLNSRLSTKNPGGMFSKEYGIKLIKNNVIDLLTTKKGDRVMLPFYGTNLHLATFEYLDNLLKRDIQNEILSAIATFEPRVNVLEFKIDEIDATDEYTLSLASNKTAITQTTESKILISLTLAMKDDALSTETFSIAF